MEALMRSLDARTPGLVIQHWLLRSIFYFQLENLVSDQLIGNEGSGTCIMAK